MIGGSSLVFRLARVRLSGVFLAGPDDVAEKQDDRVCPDRRRLQEAHVQLLGLPPAVLDGQRSLFGHNVRLVGDEELGDEGEAAGVDLADERFRHLQGIRLVQGIHDQDSGRGREKIRMMIGRLGRLPNAS